MVKKLASVPLFPMLPPTTIRSKQEVRIRIPACANDRQSMYTTKLQRMQELPPMLGRNSNMMRGWQSGKCDRLQSDCPGVRVPHLVLHQKDAEASIHKEKRTGCNEQQVKGRSTSGKGESSMNHVERPTSLPNNCRRLAIRTWTW